jgi:hypothetical protein
VVQCRSIFTQSPRSPISSVAHLGQASIHAREDRSPRARRSPAWPARAPRTTIRRHAPHGLGRAAVRGGGVSGCDIFRSNTVGLAKAIRRCFNPLGVSLDTALFATGSPSRSVLRSARADLLRRLLKEHVADDARAQLAERAVQHLELSGFEIDEGEQVMRKRPRCPATASASLPPLGRHVLEFLQLSPPLAVRRRTGRPAAPQ